MGGFFVENKGSVMLIPVPKYKTVAANFKNVFKDPRHPGTSIYFLW